MYTYIYKHTYIVQYRMQVSTCTLYYRAAYVEQRTLALKKKKWIKNDKFEQFDVIKFDNLSFRFKK